MTDPTIQMFCCYYEKNGSYVSAVLKDYFNADLYNSIGLFSAFFGILGAIYQLVPKDRDFDVKHYHGLRLVRVIKSLAVADLMANLGLLARSFFWLYTKSITPYFGNRYNIGICIFLSAWIQYFYTATWLWTFLYAFDVFLLEKNPDRFQWHFRIFAWLLPLIFTFTGLSLLYLPDAKCHAIDNLVTALKHILPNYLLTYIPLTIVMVINPFLYWLVLPKIKLFVMSVYGSFRPIERAYVQRIRNRFVQICLIFYLCWLPNIIGACLIWIYDRQMSPNLLVAIWYISAILNPLQAFFNCFIYGRRIQHYETVIWSSYTFRLIFRPFSGLKRTNRNAADNEHYPLLYKN